MRVAIILLLLVTTGCGVSFQEEVGASPAPTPTLTPTATPNPTAAPTVAPTATPTVTAVATGTPSPTAIATLVPSPTATPGPAAATPAPYVALTPTPAKPQPSPACPSPTAAPPEHKIPVVGQTWTPFPGTWRIVNFWTNLPGHPQRERKLLLSPEENPVLKGGGSAWSWPATCEDVARANYATVPHPAVALGQLREEGLAQ